MPPRELPKHRFATIYDKSAGKVHANGVLIREFDSNTSRAKANGDFKAHHIKPALKTLKKANSWIAPDVYDFERVPKRRRVMVEEPVDDDDDDDEQSDDDEDSSVSEYGDVLVAGKKARPEPERSSAKLRRFNIQDLSFLSNAPSANAGVENSHHKVDPSSDLLKSIHYYTSQFYAASGQLVNSGRRYRMSKAKSKEPVSSEGSTAEEENETSQEEDDDQEVSDGGNSSSHGGSSDRDKDAGRSDNNSDNDSDDASDADKAKNTSTSLFLGKRRQRNQRRTERHLRHFREKRDMYRAFDGSALFCIGMLLKAHIISQLKARIPEGWDDEVAAYEEHEEDSSISESNDADDSLEETGVETAREDRSTGQSEDKNDNNRRPNETTDLPGKKRKRKR